MFDEHALWLGTLVANFHSLEFCLRAFLQSLPNARPIGLPGGTDLYAFQEGAKVPESEITSYDTLGRLIKKFNDEMTRRGQSGIDDSLVRVRDAIAHGRVSAPKPNARMQLLKFSVPDNGYVEVEFSAQMSKEWFREQCTRVREAILVVAELTPNCEVS